MAKAWRRGTRDRGGTTNRKACLGVEIPTIIIFQIQRLLVSEQRNNKFNQGGHRRKGKETGTSWYPSTKKEVPNPSLRLQVGWEPAGGTRGLNRDASDSFWNQHALSLPLHPSLSLSLSLMEMCVLFAPQASSTAAWAWGAPSCSPVSWCLPVNAMLLCSTVKQCQLPSSSAHRCGFLT